MIKTWSLKNFKSVSAETSLDFAPLTIFAGANSSGKSTILQSILLTTQTIQNSVQNKTVILNGNISKFGIFNDLISNKHDDNLISIGFKLEPQITQEDEIDTYHFSRFSKIGDFKSLECKFSFTGITSEVNHDLLQLQPRLERSYLKMIKENESEEIEVVRSKRSISDRARDLRLFDKENIRGLGSLEYEIIKPARYKEIPDYYYGRRPQNAKHAGAFMDHFLPASVSIAYDRIDDEKRLFIDIITSDGNVKDKIFEVYINDDIIKLIRSLYIEVTEEAKKIETLFSYIPRFEQYFLRLEKEFNLINLRRLLRSPGLGNILMSKIDDHKTDIIKLMKFDLSEDYRLDYLYSYNAWSDYIGTFFKRNLKYLGPLRDEPKPVYPLIGAPDPKDIGFKGENTAFVLDLNRNVPIKYIPSSCFQHTKDVMEIKDSTLLDAVLDWLKYMGIAQDVQTIDKGKLGHELKIMSPSSTILHDLTHVGVGVSQVLPILVLSLLSDSDSTLIFEQPELHLHPRVQTRLADFFISMSLVKKQCLVETHSEYIINRLRYHVAVSENSVFQESILIYFVEKENENSKYRKIKINTYGVIENWPIGFFDENEENAANVLKAGMEKRNRQKEK